MQTKWRHFSSAIRGEVTKEAFKVRVLLGELFNCYCFLTNTIMAWKRTLFEGAKDCFEAERPSVGFDKEQEQHLIKFGHSEFCLDWLIKMIGVMGLEDCASRITLILTRDSAGSDFPRRFWRTINYDSVHLFP